MELQEQQRYLLGGDTSRLVNLDKAIKESNDSQKAELYIVTR